MQQRDTLPLRDRVTQRDEMFDEARSRRLRPGREMHAGAST